MGRETWQRDLLEQAQPAAVAGLAPVSPTVAFLKISPNATFDVLQLLLLWW